MQKCNECKVDTMNVSVPYVVHEAAMARSERHNKRLWICVLVLIGALIATNIGWIAYEAQFETIEESAETNITQDNENGDNNYIGNDGDITYGEADNND